MSELPSPDAHLKARVDLWMHANNLVWQQFRTLYFIQIAYFAALLFLSTRNIPTWAVWFPLISAVAFQICLIVIIFHVRRERDMHGALAYSNNGFDITSHYSSEGKTRTAQFSMRTVFITALYLSWILIDGFVAYLILEFGFPEAGN